MTWISLSGLMLIGCLHCNGTYAEKAEVFMRIVQPSMAQHILVVDKELRMAIFFLTNLATVLSYMQHKVARDGRDQDEFDINFFNRKIAAYEVVFEAVTDQFLNDMFGLYANQVTRE